MHLPSPLRRQHWLKRVTRMAQAHQIAIAEAMMRADFYSHPAPTIHRRETHISTVFLTGSFVDKMKKAVEMGFLDFSTLTRRRLLEQEVGLAAFVRYLPGCGAHHLAWWPLLASGPGTDGGVCRQDASVARVGCHVPLPAAGGADRSATGYPGAPAGRFLRPGRHDPRSGCGGGTRLEDNLQQVGTCAGVYVDHDTWEAVATATETFARLDQICSSAASRIKRLKRGMVICAVIISISRKPASTSSIALNSANSCAVWTSSATWHF